MRNASRSSGLLAAPVTLVVICLGLSSRLAFAEFEAPVDQEFTARLDGSVQRYVELVPRGLDRSAPCDVVIALHGHGSDRWQYVREMRGECRGIRDVAERRGMLFVSPDYRAKTSWMGPAAEADLVQLIEILGTRFRVRRIYLAGGSMGGTAALIFAALHPDLIAGVVSENGAANMLEYDQFQDAIAASYGGSKQEKTDEYRRRSPELIPEKLTMPIAFTVGGKDTLVPPDSVRRLAKKLLAARPKEILLLDDPEGGHATGYDETVKVFEFVMRAAEQRAAKPIDR